MRKKLVVIALLVAVVAAGYYFYANNGKASATTSPTQTATVTRGNLIATVASAGPVASASQVSLSFASAGSVKQVYVKLGDSVKQGQVLAEVDSTELQFALANAQLAMNQQQIKFDQVRAGPSASELAAAQSAVDTAQANYDAAVRKAGLNDQQLLIYRNTLDKSSLALQKAQSDYDTAVANHVTDLTALSAALKQAKLDYASAQANYNISVASIDDSAVRSAASSLSSAKANLLTLQQTPTADDLATAQAQLDQAKLSLQQAQYNMRNAQIIAPFDGTITAVNVDAGSTASSSTAALQLTNLNKLQITVNMAEVDVSRVQVGQAVNLTFDALSDFPVVSGKVTQIALVGTTTSGVVNYPVIISLVNPDSAIKVGMTANAAIVVQERDNVLIVPSKAVKTQGKTKVVQVVTTTGNVQKAVTVGLTNDSQTEILSGLSEGDKVVISTTTTTTTTNSNRGGPGGIGIPGF